MGDMAEEFRALTEIRKEKHRNWKINNTSIITTSGIPHQVREEGFLFREPGKPKIDFYPSTGRWQVFYKGGKKEVMRGGAKSFLNWYSKQ